jgi:beta-aspartyl-peptidase (threonine type)
MWTAQIGKGYNNVMKLCIFVTSLALLFGNGLDLLPSVVAQSGAPSDEPAAAEVRAIIEAQEAAWNRGDLEAFMNGYARSNRTTFVSGDEVTRGWQTVLERYKAKYSTRDKMGTLAFSDLEITPLAKDAVIVLGRWQLKRAQDNPRGRFTLIFRHLPEGWRIVQDHTSAASPP